MPVRVRRLLGTALGGAALALVVSSATAHADTGDADPLNALMMGGTGMPTPSAFWQNTIVTDYVEPATGRDYTPVLVPTPESAASTSIPVGLANLQAAMSLQPDGV